ncbi:ribosomal-processing cysteine protease Prp [Butyrivibrio proteoclasticus]|uniref:ribosomal-processing cysteine protease Prp n=1 Tax=Butyrivibrio proteoclasticus TaxID=43305 RepID=UPI00047C0323|nr:ribosomal-processing cysteine protease Prp [Butyrivibrio proteoclasticus]
MTTITITKTSNDSYKSIECKGHAGYADYGKDIVCSAISVLTINTINSIESFTKDEMVVSSDESKGIIRFEFKSEPSKEADLLLRSFELGVDNIFQQYGKKFLNIKFRRE